MPHQEFFGCQTFFDVVRSIQQQEGLLLVEQTCGRQIELLVSNGILRSFRVNGMPFVSSSEVCYWLENLLEDHSSTYKFQFDNLPLGSLNIELSGWLASVKYQEVAMTSGQPITSSACQAAKILTSAATVMA